MVSKTKHFTIKPKKRKKQKLTGWRAIDERGQKQYYQGKIKLKDIIRTCTEDL